MVSICGTDAKQTIGWLTLPVREHCVSSRVPAASQGKDAALIAQATTEADASRSRRLFTIGRDEVRIVATKARRAAITTSVDHSAEKSNVFFALVPDHLHAS